MYTVANTDMRPQQLQKIGIDIIGRRAAKRDRQKVATSQRSLRADHEEADKQYRLLKHFLRSPDLQATVASGSLDPDQLRSLGLLQCHGSFSNPDAIESKRLPHLLSFKKSFEHMLELL